MALAVDFALLVDFVAASGNHLRFERKIPGGEPDAVELQLQISLAPEVAGIFGGLEMSDEIAAAREGLLSELGDAAQMAEHGVADVDRIGREVRFVQGTLQQRAGGQDDVAGSGEWSERDDNETHEGESQGRMQKSGLHTSPRSLAPVMAGGGR